MTYSIAARDARTGQLGVAVQSHWFAAGSLVPWVRPGVGAVATQAMVEVGYGPRGLASMEEGSDATTALESLLADDDDAAVRQVAMVDALGTVATHTGADCIRMAGHRGGDGYSAQANMMLRDTVPDAMADVYERADGDLAHRLLAALDAAEAEAGDIRGRQAAGIVVVAAEPSDEPWRDTLLHLHVDDHPAPLTELRRLVELKASYDRMEEAERLDLAGEHDAALAEQEAAFAAHPDAAEFAFWTAVSRAGAGRIEEARAAIAVAFDANAGWAELLRRLADDGQIDLRDEAVSALIAVADGA
jgi:uncharacterized Ntn-hydrolase superfamily protein